MKKAKIIVVALLVALLSSELLAGCFGGGITGSGKLETREMDYGDFTKLNVGYAFEVEITRADSFFVSITLDDNLFEYLDIAKRGDRDTLYIGLDPAYSYRSFTHKAKITMPDLYGLDLSGATRGTVQGFSLSHDFSVDLSGASMLGMSDMSAGNINFDISGASRVSGDITADDADFDVSGASRAELEGSASDIGINASGASSVELDDFPVNNAEVNLSGASRGTVNLNGRLDVDLSGASNLQYIGQPIMGTINISGGSTISSK